jgi:hypothetical protein
MPKSHLHLVRPANDVGTVYACQGLPDIREMESAERAQFLKDCPQDWNNALRTWRDYNHGSKQSLSLFGSDLSGVDLRTVDIYDVLLRRSNLTGVQVGETLAVKKLSDISSIEGVIVIPKGVQRFPYSVIAINSADGVKVFHAPHESFGKAVPKDQPAQIITHAPQHVVATLKREMNGAGWQVSDDFLGVLPGKKHKAKSGLGKFFDFTKT